MKTIAQQLGIKLGINNNLTTLRLGSKKEGYIYYENSIGYWHLITYDSNGNELTYKNSDKYSYERTYDSNGNELTYKNSTGHYRYKSKNVTKDEFIKLTTDRPCVGKKVTIDGIEYILN